MKNNLVNEDFVSELLKSGVWDIARSRPKPVEEATEATETEEKATPSARDLATELFENLSEEVKTELVGIIRDAINEEKDNESLSPRELAEEILNSVDEDVTLEIVDILYKAVNEDTDEEEEDEEEESEEEEEDSNDSEDKDS